MDKIKFAVATLSMALLVICLACSDGGACLDDKTRSLITEPYGQILEDSKDLTQIPRSVNADGDLRYTGIYGWTSGFFPGNLWYIHRLTGDPKWKEEAIKWTEALDSVQYYGDDHDIGFMINCSYGNALEVAENEYYKQVMVQSAKTLSGRYDPKVKSIKSWNYKKSWDRMTEWFFPVIIDNMMNLELMFKASEISGDTTYSNIAVQHALTTMKNHYREDFSSFHVVNYDTISGKVLDRGTNQGFSDQSSWARGQAWGLYGFIICYRYTKDEKFLDFAEQIANYILTHPNLPDDKIPYWDFNANDPDYVPEWDYDPSAYRTIPRDVSAAAITASALYELAHYSDKKKDFYTEAADGMLASLMSPTYLAASRGTEYFILDHSVGSIPHGAELDVPLVYADYYFLEALLRKCHGVSFDR
ncbi:glycoside hydrolase family 88 protein [Pseudozobellia thermophila]|uniref:Glycosyl Hydrolase Family 88 n=1 Tax=Pseudozobellia thermophila TaxID=192903 RepID=A0A1M6NM48_9FLAO|nr:glycoside hydrolase family 88 protein [Pseudozobellia thermophila]SHJ96778.1 Glycosyl Hydrolase Family 88 [Pseudozobellia thermophila]